MSGGTCVIAASYEAKRLGVKTGMHIRDARKLAPNAIAVPSDFSATSLASDQLFALMERFCPGGVERASVDEGYLDLKYLRHAERNGALLSEAKERGVKSKHVAAASLADACLARCFDSAPPVLQNRRGYAQHDVLKTFATNLQQTAHRLLALPISIGIAPTKTLAKMASKHKKPKGIFIIERKDIQAFLDEKLLEDIPGIGRRLTPKLQAQGFATAADLANTPQADIKRLLGKIGIELQAELQGIPVYEIVTEPNPPKSISRCRSFLPNADPNFLYAQIATHLQRCSSKLRRYEMECGGLSVWLRTLEGRYLASEKKFGRCICEEALLLPYAKEAFGEILRARTPKFTQAGIALFDLRKKGPRQVSLFEKPNLEHITAIQHALDEIRKRFGQESVQYGGAAYS